MMCIQFRTFLWHIHTCITAKVHLIPPFIKKIWNNQCRSHFHNYFVSPSLIYMNKLCLGLVISEQWWGIFSKYPAISAGFVLMEGGQTPSEWKFGSDSLSEQPDTSTYAKNVAKEVLLSSFFNDDRHESRRKACTCVQLFENTKPGTGEYKCCSTGNHVAQTLFVVKKVETGKCRRTRRTGKGSKANWRNRCFEGCTFVFHPFQVYTMIWR